MFLIRNLILVNLRCVNFKEAEYLDFDRVEEKNYQILKSGKKLFKKE